MTRQTVVRHFIYLLLFLLLDVVLETGLHTQSSLPSERESVGECLLLSSLVG